MGTYFRAESTVTGRHAQDIIIVYCVFNNKWGDWVRRNKTKIKNNLLWNTLYINSIQFIAALYYHTSY